MKILNFKDSETSGTFRMLASLLHYSNISLQAAQQNNLEVTSVRKTKDLENAARLLGVSADDLIAQLTYRTIQMRGENVSTPLKLANAKDVHERRFHPKF